MTPKGEELTREGEISNPIFSFSRKISLGFSERSIPEEAVIAEPEGLDHQGLKMIFVLKGVLKGLVHHTKKTTLVLHDQQHNLILAGNDMKWQMEQNDHDVICLNIDFSFLSRYLPENHPGMLNLKKGIEKRETAVFSTQNLHISPEIVAILSNLKASTHTGFCERLFLESKVLELLMFQSSQFEQMNSNEPAGQLKEEEMKRMQEVKTILTENIDNQYSLRTLAHMVGTNEFNLKRNFKIAFGTTVYGYLNQYKMEMAKTMLIEKDITITELAAKMGYKYATHFSSAFKKYFGYLPNKLKSGKLSLLFFSEELSIICNEFGSLILF